MQTVLFEIGERRFAMPAALVELITSVVEIEPVPGAPDVVEGVIDVRGRLAAVYGLRRRFAMPDRRVDLADHLIIARAGARLVAVHADRALDVAEISSDTIEPLDRVTAAAPGIGALVRTSDGVLLMHDPATFLTDTEAEALDRALDQARPEWRG
jgi:purine-binding chemotaxis protein CheW